MEEQLTSFKTAKLAKEKGYSEGSYICCVQYHNDYVYDSDPAHPESHLKDDIRYYKSYNKNNIIDFSCEYHTDYECPTQSLLQKWLREKYKLIVTISYQYEFDSTPYSYWIYKENESLPLNQWIHDLNTYEEALELGLQEALKLIK